MAAAERKKTAVELRKLGFSYQKIADKIGVSRQAAHKMVLKALQELNQETAEGAEEVRRLELERLDEWHLRVAQEMTAGRALPAIDRGLRIMERRAKLVGLEPPPEVDAATAATRELHQIFKATPLDSDDSYRLATFLAALATDPPRMDPEEALRRYKAGEILGSSSVVFFSFRCTVGQRDKWRQQATSEGKGLGDWLVGIADANLPPGGETD